MVASNIRVLVRVDASVVIGTGHVMRCLTLATILRDLNVEVIFVCRVAAGDMCEYIEAHGFDVYRIGDKYVKEEVKEKGTASPQIQWLPVSQLEDAAETASVVDRIGKVDWLIVDHYSLDAEWETVLAAKVEHLMIVDDLADRKHVCDVLLDQNLYEVMEQRYEGLLSPGCRLLLGPKYSMLREEFFTARKKTKARGANKKVSRVLVFFGGSDPTNETSKALEAISELNSTEVIFDVVVGSSNSDKSKIQEKCARLKNVNFHCQINNISELMLKANVAIGAAGSASWERCFLGLPSIIIITAENQIEVARKLTIESAVINLGESGNVSVDDILTALRRVIDNPEELKVMAKNCLRLMPGNELKAALQKFILSEKFI